MKSEEFCKQEIQEFQNCDLRAGKPMRGDNSEITFESLRNTTV